MRVAWPDAFALSTSTSSSTLQVDSPDNVGADAGDARTVTPPVGDGDLVADIVGILQRGIDGLTTDEPCKRPTRDAVAKAIGNATEIQAKAAAIDARSIAQAQNRAPNIVALFAQRLSEAASRNEAA